MHLFFDATSAKGHFCSVLLSNIIGKPRYLQTIQTMPSFLWSTPLHVSSTFHFLHHSRKREPSVPEFNFWILASSFCSCSIAACFAAPKMFFVRTLFSWKRLSFRFYWLLPTSSSILLPATDEHLRFIYLYIGITLSDYTVAQGTPFCNMECCIK